MSNLSEVSQLASCLSVCHFPRTTFSLGVHFLHTRANEIFLSFNLLQSKGFGAPFLKRVILLETSATLNCTGSYIGRRGAIFKSTQAPSNANLPRGPRPNVSEKI